MKNLKILIIVFIVLFGLKDVYSLAISQPMPTNMTLKRGETLPFRFEIQGINSNQDLQCTYSINGLNPLKISFNDDKTVVKAGSIVQVSGTLEIPDNSSAKEYTGNLVVSCDPTTETEGSVIAQTMGVLFKVNVVKVEGSNKKGPMKIFLMLAGIATLLLLLDLKLIKWSSKGKKKLKEK
jgi:hypothetical protein